MPTFVDRKRLMPSQTGHAGKVLKTDGREASWENEGGGGAPELPDQTGNSGKFLTTDGSAPSWDDVPPDPDELPSQGGNSGKVLTTDGSDPAWSDAHAVAGGLRLIHSSSSDAGTPNTLQNVVQDYLSYTVPAGTVTSGEELHIRATWVITSTGNSKSLKLLFDGTTILDVTTSNTITRLEMTAVVHRYVTPGVAATWYSYAQAASQLGAIIAGGTAFGNTDFANAAIIKTTGTINLPANNLYDLSLIVSHSRF